MSFLAFLFNDILHCICFKIHFTESKYLVSNRSYTRLIRAIKKVKKSNKKLIICVIIILCNHYFIILDSKKLYSSSNKLNSIKIGLLLVANSPTPAEWKNCKLETIWSSSSMSRKRQVMGL